MLVSLADMKAYLGISGTDYDVFLTTQLQIVSDAVEEYCKRKFSLADYVQTFYLDEMFNQSLTTIPLYQYPVNSIASITTKFLETDSPTSVDFYRLHKPTGTIKKTPSYQYFGHYHGLFDGGRILEVSYNAGFSTVPSIVLGVVYAVVRERYNKKANGVDLDFGTDVQRISIPGAISIDYDYSLDSNLRKSYLGNILGNHLNELDPYRSERAVIGTTRLAYVS